MMWQESDQDDLKFMPSGAAALGPPISPSPAKKSWDLDDLGWTPPGKAADQAIAALRRCRPVTENASKPEMEAALDPNALAYASEAVAAAAAAARTPTAQNGRLAIPPLAIPHNTNPAAPPREKAEWHSGISYESDGEETLCGVPGLRGLRTKVPPTVESSGIWTTMSDWLAPLLRKTGTSSSLACCSKMAGKNASSSRALSSRILSGESLVESDAEEAEPERQSTFWLPRHQAPTLAPPMVAAVVGPLGVPVAACRQKQTPLSAIYELPAQFNSGTYDDMHNAFSGKESHSISEGGKDLEDDLPDPVLLGLTPAEEIARPPCGSYHGLGRARRGHIGPIGCCPSVLVTELLLPRPLDCRQKKSVHASLRSGIGISHGSDLAAPLGAVPARLECGGAGIWAVWFDSLGVAARQPEWLLPWKPSNVPLASSGLGARPLREALRPDPATNSSYIPQWRFSTAHRIAAAIAELHSAGRSHGSLTPCSIWVSPTASVSITEAGLVDVLLDTGVLYEHELLSCLGLEYAKYLPPEGWQMPRRTDRAAKAAADVWALGFILLEVLDGASAPHAECKTLQHLSSKVLPKRGHQPVPRLRSGSEYAQLPAIVRHTIEACLSALPEARPSAEEVLSSLTAHTVLSCDTVEAGWTEECIQDKLRELRVFSDASTTPSCTPSNATTGEESTFSSASSCVNAAQPNLEVPSQDPCKSSVDSSVSALERVAHDRRKECDDSMMVDEQECGVSNSAQEFYSGVVESTREISSEVLHSPRNSRDHALATEPDSTEIVYPGLTLNFLKNLPIDEIRRSADPPKLAPPSPPEMLIEQIPSEKGFPCRDDLQGSRSCASRELLSAHSGHSQTMCIRTPREKPPPPPEPTFEEMLLSLPTPVRNRSRGKENVEKVVVSKKVPPPPPAAAPPLIWQ